MRGAASWLQASPQISEAMKKDLIYISEGSINVQLEGYSAGVGEGFGAAAIFAASLQPLLGGLGSSLARKRFA